MHTPRDGRSRVLSDRKVLFHSGFRGDETGVSGDDGHFFSSSSSCSMCFPGKNFQREKGESRCRRFDTHGRERERKNTAQKRRRFDPSRKRERTERSSKKKKKKKKKEKSVKKIALT